MVWDLRIDYPGAINDHRSHHLFNQMEILRQKLEKYAAIRTIEQSVKQEKK